MAIIEAPIRTGLTRAGRHGPIGHQRRAMSVAFIKNPVIQAGAPSYGFRAKALEEKPPYDFRQIERAYTVDSYIRQGIDKYAEMVLKEGWRLSGREEAVRYVTRRLELMALQTHEPWELFVDKTVRDFIKYGKPASYHSYLAKSWGLLLAITVVSTRHGRH